jgi:hypothetical protein
MDKKTRALGQLQLARLIMFGLVGHAFGFLNDDELVIRSSDG